MPQFTSAPTLLRSFGGSTRLASMPCAASHNAAPVCKGSLISRLQAAPAERCAVADCECLDIGESRPRTACSSPSEHHAGPAVPEAPCNDL